MLTFLRLLAHSRTSVLVDARAAMARLGRRSRAWHELGVDDATVSPADLVALSVVTCTVLNVDMEVNKGHRYKRWCPRCRIRVIPHERGIVPPHEMLGRPCLGAGKMAASRKPGPPKRLTTSGVTMTTQPTPRKVVKNFLSASGGWVGLREPAAECGSCERQVSLEGPSLKLKRHGPKAHRCPASGTTPDGVQSCLWSVLEDLWATQAVRCSTCARAVPVAASWGRPVAHVRPGELTLCPGSFRQVTPEDRLISLVLADEALPQDRHAAHRQPARSRSKQRPTSVHVVSAGLPSLGRRR